MSSFLCFILVSCLGVAGVAWAKPFTVVQPTISNRCKVSTAPNTSCRMATTH